MLAGKLREDFLTTQEQRLREDFISTSEEQLEMSTSPTIFC
jgi:hypothetical protein